MRVRHLALALLVAAGCDGGDKSAGPPPAAAPTAPTGGAPAAGAPAAPGVKPAAPKPPAPPPKGTVLEEARRRNLTKDDFTESPNNRDPFRSFLSSFAAQQVINKQHKIILEKFTIDELKLVGIVTGEIQPRAMFIDPSGQGVAVVRGDHISKVDALVTRVAPDRVYLRIEEDVGQDKPRVTEREIDLHAGELTAQ